MSAKHTPGTWEVDTDINTDVVSDGGIVADCGLFSGPVDEDEQIANARLIAAAPELLKHLKIAMEYLPHVSIEWAKKARATIAKAEGRQ